MGREHAPEPVLQGGGRLRGGQPPFFRLVDGQDGRTAGAGGDHEIAAPGRLKIGQGLGKIKQFLDGVGPVHPVLAEQGLVDGVGAGQGLGVGLRRLPPPPGAPGLEDDQGLGAEGEGVQEVGGALHPLEVEGDDLGFGVGVEILDDLGLVHVDAVPQGNEGRHPKPFRRGQIQEGGAHGTALGGEGDFAGGGDERPGGAHAVVGHVDALAVGSHHLEAGLPDHPGHVLLQALPLRPGLGKPPGDDDGPLDSPVSTLLQGRGDQPGGDDHHRQFRGFRRVGNGFINLEATNLVGLGVDGVQGSRETAVFEVGQDVVPQFAGRGGSADNGHAFGLEDSVQAG